MINFKGVKLKKATIFIKLIIVLLRKTGKKLNKIQLEIFFLKYNQ